MYLADFDYHLPDELIAQVPLEDRAGARMLVVDRKAGTWADSRFRDLPSYLATGDCVAINDSRVFPSRLLGTLAGRSGQVEIFLLRSFPGDASTWSALARPAKRLRLGSVIQFNPDLTGEIVQAGDRGERVVRFQANGDVRAAIEAAGHVPLPPYIRRSDDLQDRARYQTVYADRKGSVAAPTAGLHFTDDIVAQCRAAGATVARLTLHVGLGTFQPLDTEQVEENHLHSEWYEMSANSAESLRNAERIVAVGTTSVRTIETIACDGPLRAATGETDLFVYPGYQFQAVGAMLTNFHLPKSSLIILVSAFAGRDLTLAAYEHAVRERYRFFSYGDCMLIL